MFDIPLVSVIIPIYKVEPYLRQCVESVIAQTYKNLEIILVDDGSPDNCPKICDKYSQTDKRIKVIHKPNGGLSDARNAGIEIAKGDYLSFVDSDDVIHSQMIDTLMRPLIKDNTLGMSVCRSLNFENDDELSNKTINLYDFKILDFRDFFMKNLWVTAWGKVYKKELFSIIKFPVGRIHEDEFTTHKVCYETKKIAYTESQIYFYRQREGSIMNQMTVKRIVDKHDAFKGQVDFFLEHNENVLYSRFLMNFVYSYSIHKQYTKTLKDSKDIISLWKSELKNYSIKTLPFKQKIDFILMFRFSKFRLFLRKCIMGIK